MFEFPGSPFASTPLEKRRSIVLLRGLLVFALGALLLQSGAGQGGAVPGASALLVLAAVSNALLLATPLRSVAAPGFDLVVGTLDLGFLAWGLHLAGQGRGVLPVSCLVMGLVVALGHDRTHKSAGAAVVLGLHVWLSVGLLRAPISIWHLASETMFLAAVGLYYGYLAEGIHLFRRREEAELLERQDLTALLDILAAITSSIELRQVAQAIVTKIAKIIPAVRCSMILADPDSAEGVVLASNDNPDLGPLRLDLNKYPEVRRAIETRHPVLIQDVFTDPLMAGVAPLLKPLTFNSIMVVPMVFGDEVLGTLALKTARCKQQFSPREVNFCTAVARASANALKNALLHRQVLEESTRHRHLGRKLSNILDHSPDLILTTDNEGRITEFNRGAGRLLGRRREEVLGQPCDLLFGEAGADGLVARILADGQISNHACRLVDREGKALDCQVNMSVLPNDAGEIVGTVWIGRDVTELKAAQTQLIQAEKLSTIGEVISGVAHELNNPLSGVLGYSQLILSRYGTNPLARKVERIHESALRCQKIVKNLLAFARGHRPERKYLGLNGIIDKTLDMKRYQLHVNSIVVERDLDATLPRTMLDFHQIQQVLLNLINNAQQAMTSVDGRPRRLRFRTCHHNGVIRLEIADTGEGMPQATLERIFDPFFTTKSPGRGTGLGLSVSYGIIRDHGGTIGATSRPDQGTTFCIELPVTRDPGEPAAGPCDASPSAVAEAACARSILIVDDEPMIVDLLLDLFDQHGYRIDTAANGKEACRKIGEGRYDLVISDVRMPEMNGIELYRRILVERPEMEGRVIFVTGDLLDTETARFLAETGAPTVAKPIEIEAVVTLVEETLERHEPVPA